MIGGIGGALLGNAIGHGGGREGGTIIGGVGGAAAGAAVGGSTVHCGENRYGWYDERGEWIPRQRTDRGWYGPDGAWVAVDASAPPPAYGYDRPGYAPPPPPPGRWDGDSHDTRAREAWMENRINREMADGRMDEHSAHRALRQLAEIRDMDAAYRQNDGHLSGDQYRDIDYRLDQLNQTVRASAD